VTSPLVNSAGQRKKEMSDVPFSAFLHGTQLKQGIIERLGIKGAESHVKDFMIRHAKLLGISSKDVDVLKDMLGG
jgi:hypothetical protein